MPGGSVDRGVRHPDDRAHPRRRGDRRLARRPASIDPYHRVYGHPGLHVVDGAAVSANLGVNPSLTITAQAERAMSLWPNRGEPDPRPALGTPYRRLAPVAPARPAVPARTHRRRCVADRCYRAAHAGADPGRGRRRAGRRVRAPRAGVRGLRGDASSATGRRALAMRRREPPDLVVLDVMLPGLDGFGVCRRAAGDRRATPMVLMLTARDATADRVAGLDAGRRRLPGQAVRVRGAAGPGAGAAAPPAAPAGDGRR